LEFIAVKNIMNKNIEYNICLKGKLALGMKSENRMIMFRGEEERAK